MKRNEKYLFCDERGVWHLHFRCPARFGGKIIRQSLFTCDFLVASAIRDKFVTPVLACSSAVSALEQIGKSIISANSEAVEHLGGLRDIIDGKDGITLAESFTKYKKWLTEKSGLRPRTIYKYISTLERVINILGGDKLVARLSRSEAVNFRNRLQNCGKSNNCIADYFLTVRIFLRWLFRDGILHSQNIAEYFLIDLPPSVIVNTEIIPPSKADLAVFALPSLSLFSFIQRYTGMRIGEVFACVGCLSGCGFVEIEGIKCFKISREFSKTHADRFIPICDKLSAHLTADKLCKGKEFASAENSISRYLVRYNKAVKRIEGCENTSSHSWRVYAQTMMIEAGVDDLIVRRIIGHKGKNDVHYGYTFARVEAMKKSPREYSLILRLHYFDYWLFYR